ncbi:sigma-70 family RNA polymerase sigma factor [Sphingobacterium sp. DK4209]|uniref:Sigma-70 family RNA polymerase sigma factor n=1 Tax=Sphingobacterium zhuxiongii TaxID=2662364 RepID=A0A5Q0QC48_9SPHI|nr:MULTISPECIES: sigma-70 family RNA polymerase sigma factor [unclassified Sphingobacterium]MVZ65634.1 sigma-70 family RNA polymerase sigma factor [Sphingobacterium sp. DK4209]QGA27757.1 sigma-70 family RNA polymerase sigma factor [Sphingobacterium sp. dk4302]
MEPEKIIHIWDRCKNNDRKAQAELYQLFAPKMYAICLRYARDTFEAEDMLQQGFIKVFTKSALFDGTGVLEGWIRRIMVNTAIESYRKNKLSFISTDQVSTTELAGHASLQLNNLDYKDLLRLIKDLPLGYKTVFNLYAIEGYNHREIAELLQISEGNSKSQLSRARQWLRERILKMEELGI